MRQETLISKTYELLKVGLPIIEKFPRSHKFTLGERLENQLLDLLELYIQAYYEAKEQKTPLLQRANILLEKTRYLLRLSHEMRMISMGQYKDLSERLLEIGRMTGGWIKSLA